MVEDVIVEVLDVAGLETVGQAKLVAQLVQQIESLHCASVMRGTCGTFWPAST